MLNKNKILSNDRQIKERKLEEQAEYIKYLESQNKIQQDQIRKLKSKINENESNFDDYLIALRYQKQQEIVDLQLKLKNSDVRDAEYSLDIQKRNAKIDNLEEENIWLKQAIENYRQMPDLRNMIDNLQSLSSPNLDKIVELANKLNDSDIGNQFKEVHSHLGNIQCQVEEIKDRMGPNVVVQKCCDSSSRWL